MTRNILMLPLDGVVSGKGVAQKNTNEMSLSCFRFNFPARLWCPQRDLHMNALGGGHMWSAGRERCKREGPMVWSKVMLGFHTRASYQGFMGSRELPSKYKGPSAWEVVTAGSGCTQSSAAQKRPRRGGVWPNKRGTTKNANSTQGTSPSGVFLQLEMLKEEVVIVKTKGTEVEAVAPCDTFSLICADTEALVGEMMLMLMLATKANNTRLC